MLKPEAHSEYDYQNLRARGLIGYWPFWEGQGERVEDVVKKNEELLGTVVNGNSWQGDFLSLDGISQYVSSALPEDLTMSFSWFGWFRTSDLSVDQRAIWMGDGTLLNRFFLWMDTGDGADGWAVSLSGIETLGTTFESAIADKWQHVGVTSETSGDLLLWVDGEVVEAGTSGAAWATQPDLTYFGRFQTNYAELDIDEIKLWDRPLTADEVVEEYNNKYELLMHPLFDRFVPLPAGNPWNYYTQQHLVC